MFSGVLQLNLAHTRARVGAGAGGNQGGPAQGLCRVLLRSPTLCPPELRAQRAVRDTTLRHGASGLVAASLEGNHVFDMAPERHDYPATGPVPVR